MARALARVLVWFQDTPGAESKAGHSSPWRTELRVHGRMRVRFCLYSRTGLECVPNLTLASGSPSEVSIPALKWYSDFTSSILNNLALVMGTKPVFYFQTYKLFPHKEKTLTRVRVRSRKFLGQNLH